MAEVWLFIVLGAGTGSLYALASLGVVLTYRGSGVINFSSGAMGLAGGFTFWELRDNHGWPLPLALMAGILGSALLGYLAYLLMRPMRAASNLTKVVFSLALLVIIVGALGLRYDPQNSYTVPAIFPTTSVDLLGARVGMDRLILIAIAIVLTVVVSLVYRFTRFGLATTGVAENAQAVATLGWSTAAIAALNWAVGAGLSGLAAILLAPVTGLSLGLATGIILPALAAAVVGDLRSFSQAALGGFAIGIIQALVLRFVPVTGLRDAVPLLLIILIIAARGRRLPQRSHVAERLPRVTNGVISVPKLIVWVAAGAVTIWFLLPAGWLSAVTTSLLAAIVLQSIVVITGYAGQLSLAQWAVAGACGWVMTRLIVSGGLSMPAAILLALASAVPIGLVMGSAAVRARGMSLAISTLAFGVCTVSLLLSNSDLTGGVSGLHIGPFTLLGIDLDPLAYPKRFAVIALIVVVLISLALASLRRSSTGRRMLAVRANERAAAALGLSVAGIKLTAFVYGSVIAAVAGILSLLRFPTAVFSGFDVFTSIQMVAYSVLGGVGYVTGPLAGSPGVSGGAGAAVLNLFSASWVPYVTVVFGVLTLLVILQAPDGIVRMQSEANRKLSRLLFRRLPRAARLPASLPEGEPPAASRPGAHLEVNGLTVRFGGVTAIRDLDVELTSGEVVGVIGPNGAGKTTMIDAITGFVRSSCDSMTLDGQPLRDVGIAGRARLGISRAFQSLELFEDLTVFENIVLSCERRRRGGFLLDLLRPGRPQLTGAAVTAVRELGLEEHLNSLPGALSYGTRRLVAIARAIASNPKMLLLDEPAAGLDQAERGELADLIRRLAADWRMAILLIEHDVSLVAAVSDRMLALDFGEVIVTGTPHDVVAHPRVVSSYLGVEPEPAGVEPPAPGDTTGSRTAGGTA